MSCLGHISIKQTQTFWVIWLCWEKWKMVLDNNLGSHLLSYCLMRNDFHQGFQYWFCSWSKYNRCTKLMATYWDCSNVQWDCCRQKLCTLFPRMVVSCSFPALWGNFLTEDDLGHLYLFHQHQRELGKAKKQTKITIKINNIQTVKKYFLDSFFIARLFLLLQITIWEQLSSCKAWIIISMKN